MRLGIDIGGTSVKIGVIDNYKIIDSYSIPTKKESLFDDIFISIKNYCDKNDILIEGIGFGIPGNVDKNYVHSMPNIGLYDIDLNKLTKKYYSNISIYSSNDANCAALGEHINNPKYHSSYLLTLGTGVGGGVIINDKLYEGYKNAAGEIGHMFIGSNYNFKCTCGLTSCLETVASSTGIVRLYRYHFHEFNSGDVDNSTTSQIFAKAKEGDKLSLFVVDTISKALAHALANIAVTINPDVFYIAGGVSLAGDILINTIRKYYKEYSHYAVKDTPIEIATLKEKAGMLGAAYLW